MSKIISATFAVWGLSVLLAFPAITALLAFPTVTQAQSIEDVNRAKSLAALEPSVSEIVRVALNYFRVSPQAVDSLRNSARARGALPLIAAGYRYDDDSLARKWNQLGTTTITDANEGSNRKVNSFSVGAVWDLRELMMNPAEIQAYGLVGVQRDVMLEVARTYYLRRQMVLRLILRPSEDPVANLANEVRVDELTAILDVLTDGWFSRESARRRMRATARHSQNPGFKTSTTPPEESFFQPNQAAPAKPNGNGRRR